MLDKIEYRYTPKSGMSNENEQVAVAKDIVVAQYDAATKPKITFGVSVAKSGTHSGMTGDFKEIEVFHDGNLIGYLICFIDDSKRNFRAVTLPKS